MKNTYEILQSLRAELHQCAEPSGHEYKTKATLIDFIRRNTELEIHDCGDGFYASFRSVERSAYRSTAPANKAGIAFRADYDALVQPSGCAAHLCGHDGHAAALCGTALKLAEIKPDRDVFLIFQPAEEIGAGAAGCCDIFEHENISEIYGMHNLPEYPLGEVYVRDGTFACASRGVTLNFIGKTAHAAYPENGISPSLAVGNLLTSLPDLAAPGKFSGMVLCTPIGVRMGERAFGKAASDAEIWLTLRSEHDCDLVKLHSDIIDNAGELAERYHLQFNSSEQDVFPSTENTAACVSKVIERCGAVLLDKPMRWSEDFGHYLHHCEGAFFGIGSGLDQPPLHDAEYNYPDELLPYAVEAFIKLI